MKTQTSKTRIWLSTFLVLPILAILFYSFAEREYVEKDQDPLNSIQQELDKANKLNVVYIDGATKEQVAEYNAWAKKKHTESEKLSNDAIWYPQIDEQDLIKFSDIYKRMSSKQKNNAVEFPFPNLDVKPSEQQKATKEQIKDYNTWAKKMNTAIKKAEATNGKNDYPIIKKKEYDKYYNIYRNLMSEKQRANAEAWPNIPPPPPPPPSVPEPPKTKKSEGSNGSPINASKQKKLPVIYVNEKEPIKGHIALTKEELKKLKLTLSEGNVTNFKLKIPGIKTDAIQGNTISATSIKNLDNFDDGMITIFDIKDEKENRLPPIIIQLKK